MLSSSQVREPHAARVAYEQDSEVRIVGLDLVLIVGGYLGQNVPAAVHQAALAEAGPTVQLERGDQARTAVGDAQQRRPQTTGLEIRDEVVPG
jgi:hypothetical protein